MKKVILIAILMLCLFLNIYGMGWGLPSRWCIDEPVAGTLRMMAEGNIVPKDDYNHPTFNYFVLMVFMAPALIFLKITHYPLDAAASAASVSWNSLSITDPAFASAIYIVARFSSALIAVLIVYLAYRMAKNIFSERAGIFTALFLSVTMSFISEAHTAKSTMLLILMVMLTLLCCMHYRGRAGIARYIVPFFVGGLAIATKYNGGIVLFPLAYYLVALVREERKPKAVFLSAAALAAGFITGFPAVAVNFTQYAGALVYYKENYLPQSHVSAVPIFISGLLGYMAELKDIFGVGLFLVIICGLAVSFTGFIRRFEGRLILWTIVPYYLIFSANPKMFEAKYIILIVPFLVVLASGFIDKILTMPGLYKKAALAGLGAVWVISFLYTFAVCDIYARKDIRYDTAAWIKKHIDKDKRIIVIGPAEWSIHARLFKDRDITILGNNKRFFDPRYNRRFLKGTQINLTAEEARDIARKTGGRHDYIIIYPVFLLPDRIRLGKTKTIMYESEIDLERQKKIRTFSRGKGSFWWNPNLGGYEPSAIVVSDAKIQR